MEDARKSWTSGLDYRRGPLLSSGGRAHVRICADRSGHDPGTRHRPERGDRAERESRGHPARDRNLDAGLYKRRGAISIPNLPSGEYQVVISKPGFASAIGEGVSIRAGVQIRVDLVLQPAGVTEAVAVRASALDSAAISNSTTLDEKLVKDLPVIVSGTKRDITAMLANLPGFTGGGTFTPRANGANVGETEVFVDGGRAAQQIQRGAFAEVGPAIEQVGEFSVVSNGFNAEYGGFGIWFSNVTIKSGTNTFSGSVFDHFGHDSLNAKSYFQQQKTPYKQHEGGFTLGGPIKRDKTFFFGSLGAFYSRVGQGAAVITVPTEAFKAGDFSALGVPIFDPATTRSNGQGGVVRDQFPGNIIPANRISPAARALLQYMPAPDLAGANNNFFDRRSPTWPSFDTYTPLIKITHNLTTSQRLMGSYTAQIRHRVLWGQPGSGLGPKPAWGDAQVNPLDWITDQVANSWKVRFNHDYVINPQMLNHVVVSVDRYVNRGGLKTVGQGWNNTLGISGIPADNGAFPSIQFSGGTAVPVNFGRAYDEDWKDLSWGIAQNLTMSRGQHTMKFGGEFGWTGINRNFTGGAPGTFAFSNFTTSQPSSPQAASQGNAFASFLLGDVFSTSALIPDPTRMRYLRYALFAQDEWRPTSKITLSYGLRWDHQPPFYEADDKMSSAILTLPNPAAGGLPGRARLCLAGRRQVRPVVRGFLVWRVRSAARARVCAGQEDSDQGLLGPVLQRHRRSDIDPEPGIHKHAGVLLARQLHAGVQSRHATPFRNRSIGRPSSIRLSPTVRLLPMLPRTPIDCLGSRASTLPSPVRCWRD